MLAPPHPGTGHLYVLLVGSTEKVVVFFFCTGTPPVSCYVVVPCVIEVTPFS